MLYNEEAELLPKEQIAAMDKAVIRRSGQDLSLITYGGSLGKTLVAADQLASEGINAEVIDLRCLRPLDKTTLLESLSRTHRAVLVDESWKTGGMAAEISAMLMEEAFWDLDAPVLRVCSQEVPIPYPEHLERAALPQVADIIAAVKSLPGVL